MINDEKNASINEFRLDSVMTVALALAGVAGAAAGGAGLLALGGRRQGVVTAQQGTAAQETGALFQYGHLPGVVEALKVCCRDGGGGCRVRDLLKQCNLAHVSILGCEFPMY